MNTKCDVSVSHSAGPLKKHLQVVRYHYVFILKNYLRQETVKCILFNYHTFI